jgi:hypothetical protein
MRFTHAFHRVIPAQFVKITPQQLQRGNFNTSTAPSPQYIIQYYCTQCCAEGEDISPDAGMAYAINRPTIIITHSPRGRH